MTATTFIGHFLGPDTHANRPSASGLPNGTLYVCTTHSKIERVVSGAWVDYATLGGGAGIASDTIFDAKGDIIAASAADTAARLAVGSDGQILTADSAQTLGVKWAAAGGGGAWVQLYSNTLGSSGNWDVTSISGSYNDLACVLITRGSGATNGETIKLTVNNDTGANYYREGFQSAGTVTNIQNAEFIGATNFGIISVGANATAGSFGYAEMMLYGYASTVWRKPVEYKAFSYQAKTTGTLVMHRYDGFWDSTAAINRITVIGTNNANFGTGSQLRIYGRL